MKYQDKQFDIQKMYFDKNEFGGYFMGKNRDFVLMNREDNFICSQPYSEIISYFDKNKIGWWKGKQPTGHILSSQIACINHLFDMRNDPTAVLSIAKQIDSTIDGVELLNNDTEGTRGYISFEVVSDVDHLNEKKGKNKKLTRGSQCTSIDALILATRGKERVMLVIEWKYVEHYGNSDKSKNSKDKKDGDTRVENYAGENVENHRLIQNSNQLVQPKQGGYRGSVYFYEPFYQLMRQTLWAEQMIKHRDEETIIADDFIHVHVVPEGNKELLDKEYKVSKKRMKETWVSQLKDPSKYVLISPERLLKNLPSKYNTLKTKLQKRYWQ